MIEFIGTYSSETLLQHNDLNHGPIWEIMYCLEGSGMLISGPDRFSFHEKDIIVQKPYVQHHFSPDTQCRDIYLMLNEPFPFDRSFLLHDSVERDIHALLQMLLRLLVGNRLSRENLSRNLVGAILEYIHIFSENSHRSQMVETMENMIIENISNPDFRLGTMYQSLYISDDHARENFLNEIGCTPHEYLTNRRIEQAIRLFTLSHGNASISEVAIQVGFPDAQYFSRVFRQRTGQSPRSWIQQNILSGDSSREECEPETKS